MPAIDFQALRAELTMQQVLELLDYRSTADYGDQLRGPCPIHGSSSQLSRIFSVNLSRKAFQCFKCGATGNELELFALAHNLPLFEGSLLLCEKLGIEPPPLRKS